MKQAIIAIVCMSLVLTLSFPAQTSDQKQIEKARQAVAKLGTGEKARVEVILHDTTKLKGYIASTSTDSFTLMEDKSRASRDIRFSEVYQLKKRGRSGIGVTGGLIIGALATLGVILVANIIRACKNEMGC